MTTRGEINSNFYQIVDVDANGAPTQIKPEYIPTVGANYANNAGNLVVVGNETNVYVKTSNVNIDSHTQSGNTYTHQYQNSQYWGVYPEDDNTGAHPAWSWIEASLPTVNTPTFFIETKPGDTGIEQRWTFDSRGNLTLPGNTFSVNYANGNPVNLDGPVANANYANFAGTAYNVSGSNVTGYVADATHATVANTANSVQLANVVGIGNIASINLTGSSSNVLYGNGVFAGVTATNANYANYAGNAFNVSGSNVSGEVANANYASYSGVAGSANSVAVANVSGIGNIATINLDGSSSTVLYGNGVFSTLTLPTGSGISNGTSNVNIPVANGNVNTSVGGVANIFVVTTTGANITGNLSTSGQITSTGTGNSSDGGGQLFLNGSGNNRIDFNTNGVNAPTDTTRSAGTKITLYPALSGTQTDYAIGIDAATLWSSVPVNSSSFKFKWYGNTTEVANLDGTGNLSVVGNISSGNANLGNLTTSNYFSGSGNLLSNIQLANINGIGNIASINLDGSSSNVLYGNGVWSPIVIPTGNGISNGTSNVSIPAVNGNVNTSVGGVANVFVVTTTGANVNGNLYTTANITGNSLQLNTSTGVTTANVGAMFWDATEQTVTLGMNNGVQQQIGLESYILVKANSAITNGQVVMMVGAAGEHVLAEPANMSSVGFRPGAVLGVATQDIANAGTGYITTFGQVHDVNTNAYNVGDLLYLDPASTTGGLTATQPTAPNYHIEVATVTKKSGTGHLQIIVRINDKVSDLSDANITTPTAGQALIYTSSNTWVNGNSNYANTAGTVVTGAQPNITSTGTLVSLTVTGNISSGNANLGNLTTSNYFSGNGSLLTAITAANISGTVANANYAAYAGNVTIGAQPNITSISPNTALLLGNGNGGFGTGTRATFSASGGVQFDGGTACSAVYINTTVFSVSNNANILGTANAGNFVTSGTVTFTGGSNIANLQLTKYNELLPASANTSTSISPDLSTGSIFRYTANANFTFSALTNAVSGSSAVVIITQDGTGNRVLTSTMLFAGASKTLSTAAAAVDIISVFYDGTNYYATLSKGYA